MKRFVFIFVLAFLQLQFNLSFANDPKIPESVDLRKEINLLKVLLKTNSEEFYKEALGIKNHQIQDKAAAVDFFFLFAQYHYDLGKFDSMSWSLNQAKKYIDPPNSEKLTSVLLQLGTAFYFIGNVDSLNFYQQKAAEIIDEKSPYFSQYLLLDGLGNLLSAKYTKSIESFIQAAKILESQNDRAKLAIVYNNLAVNYAKIQMHDLELNYLLKALEINKELNVPYHLAINYNNIGSSYKTQGNLEKAASYYKLAYENLVKLKSEFLLAQNLTNRANIHEKLKEYDIAEKLFLECESICEKNQILYGKMLSALNLGNLYRILGRFTESEIKLNQALELTITLKIKKEEGFTLERLFWLARDRKEFAKALDFQTRYYALNDSIVSNIVKREANELREQYEGEKKENQIITLSRQKLSQQYVIALMATGLLIFIVLAQWWRNKHRIAKENLKVATKIAKIKEETIAAREKDLMNQVMEKVVLQEHLDSLIERIETRNFDNLISKVKSIQKKQNPWDGMLKKFQSLHPDFINTLTKNYPVLSKGDVEFCSLVRMNLSNKEIAQMLHINVDSVFTKKYRIMKKLNLPKDKDFTNYLHNV
jgi:tetratricopeptide (TPR) repeat protein/DNA-binding CsgD family transcriptional regulator